MAYFCDCNQLVIISISFFKLNYTIINGLQPIASKEVLWLHFGLEDGQEWTLGAIAKKLNLGRERVRQLKHRALTILKTKNLGSLRDYIAV